MNALSASFSAMAEQLQAASKTFVSATPGASAGPSLDPSAVLAALNELSSRIDKVERAQTMLNEDFDDLRSQMDRLSTTSDSRVQSSAASEIQEEHTPKPSEKRTPGIAEEDMEAVMGRVTTQLETRIAELIENFRLDQSRLYARLHNATCTQQKMQIKPLPMKNGKTPANFPNTKGEFEHLTSCERYEYILKSYDQPIRGDTAAKRDACRVFLGLPPP
ncbi:hypothetical protein PUNSTDRAFT_107380 [Punctularia strigosozonata HHB-11173 SS5]|uniref:Uncharacterized protein n=1 Tax=Punctularia strigosozonata (strain HHB-11173) TaxID=741275 RepID=R7S3X2_PUNST|nr:uncharacterized protein PUNSTDRAFT_107380 [Punctularia strigosozonata HHB-11173 SS5]EIN05085.1 hypothetical protein PUNSTDRAFT_107380 [Punctularia strigosozonata HHB-11173 SS5]